MVARLEHANLVVRDVESMIRFLQTALPEFRIRHEGRNSQGGRWVHIGSLIPHRERTLFARSRRTVARGALISSSIETCRAVAALVRTARVGLAAPDSRLAQVGLPSSYSCDLSLLR